MNFVGVSGVNPSFGAQHLGHYASVCRTLDTARERGCCILLLDDYLSRISLPRELARLKNRTLFIASEYFSLGYEEPDILLIRSSRLPQIFSIMGLLSERLVASTMVDIFRSTALGRMSPSYRHDFGLDIPAKLVEVTYPALATPAMAIGLNAEFVYGGLEVEGYVNTIRHISRTACLRQSELSISEVEYFESPCPYVRGIDGNYMTNRNAIFISDSEAVVQAKLESISDEKIIDEYLSLLLQDGFDPIRSTSAKIDLLIRTWVERISNMTLSKPVSAIDIERRLEINEGIVRDSLNCFWNKWVEEL